MSTCQHCETAPLRDGRFKFCPDCIQNATRERWRTNRRRYRATLSPAEKKTLSNKYPRKKEPWSPRRKLRQEIWREARLRGVPTSVIREEWRVT